ncbi:MAG: polyhydroxyalkanoic acid synthase [Betaproteobacteria bacterium]|nr:polyhydroxyalkanoic acid synthase [Betaproteobacteria bacterium]
MSSHPPQAAPASHPHAHYAQPQSLLPNFVSGNADRMLHAQLGKLTGGLSPASLAAAWSDWALHLALSPSKQAELVEMSVRQWERFGHFLTHAQDEKCERCIEPLPQDPRFRDPAWQQWPFNVMSQSFLLGQQWMSIASRGVRGVTKHHEKVLDYTTRQCMDLFAPSNFIPTNPEVLRTIRETGGMNLLAGAAALREDMERTLSGAPPAGSEDFEVGRNLALTPGKVVLRNDLIELIQYTPTTARVHAEPILMVPAWIMKYYILDLTPQKSLIKYLVDQGHTVFTISWKNPGPADRDLSMDDYLRQGVMAAMDAVSAIVPKRRIHAMGYCLGGTLLAIAAALMAREGDRRLATMTLLAAQTDFSEPGELALYIDDSQLTFLEDQMWEKGYLDSAQMSGAFQLLRSVDLVWSRMVQHYLKGEPSQLNDLMAWNADGTRMPYRMHTDYLHSLFLNNELATGRFNVWGRPIAIQDIDIPIFCVGTVTDHVAPWRSVYKINLLTHAEITFALTTGGHNVGVVNPPSPESKRRYKLATRAKGGDYVDPDAFEKQAKEHPGSWWTAWEKWVADHSTRKVAPPKTGAPGYGILGDAPGDYVRQR